MAGSGPEKKNQFLNFCFLNYMFTIDAHLDLAMNAMEWNRDLRLDVYDIRKTESGLSDRPDRARGTVSFPALKKGEIGLVVATQIARYVDQTSVLPGWHSAEQAWAQTQGQLAWYREMERQGELKAVTDLRSLEEVLALWQKEDLSKDNLPIGYIRSLEGADSLVTLDHLHIAHKEGLRAVGPAHYGPGRFAYGTDSSAPLRADGKALLREMDSLHMILDVTHLCDKAFWEALDLYQGPVWASHNNCRALVHHNRQFSDEMIRALIQRGAVIGGALDAWMMVPDWQRGLSTPLDRNCSLQTLFQHMDHICQLAGNTHHIGIGSDLDGAFGKEQTPYDLEDISDLSKMPIIFSNAGYSTSDIKNIMSDNWLRFLRKAWSEI